MFDSRLNWWLRPEDELDNDSQFYPIYDSDPYLFSIRVHYGGTFHLTPLREYVGGKVRVIDQIEEDYFNLNDMDVIALGARYQFKSLVMYLWQVPGQSLDNGLRPMQCDEHVVDFLYHASYQRFMDVYFDDNPMRCITLLTTAIPSTVKITPVEDNEYDLIENDLGDIELFESDDEGDSVEGDGEEEEQDSDDHDVDEQEEDDHGAEDEAVVEEEAFNEDFAFIDDEDEVDQEFLDWLNGPGAPPEVPLPDTPPTGEPVRPQVRGTEEILNCLRGRLQYSDSEEDAPCNGEDELEKNNDIGDIGASSTNGHNAR